MLILYPATFLKVFHRDEWFSVESLGSFKYRIVPSQNRNNLTSAFPIHILLFLSLALLLWIGIHTLHWTRVESRHPCLVPDFRGNGFSFSLFSKMLALGLLCIFLPFLASSELLSWRDVQFSMIMRFFTLYSVYMLYYVYWFVEPSLHSWHETDVIMVCGLSHVLWNLYCKCFIENLCICSRRKFVYSFLFLLGTWFWHILAVENQCGSIPSLSISWTSLSSHGVSRSLEACGIQQWVCLVRGCSLLGESSLLLSLIVCYWVV
jgi:hypothetical protein